MIKLSPAGLNLLRDCPRCFWMDQVQHIKRPQGPMASIAVGLDSKIKAYCNAYRASGTLPPLLKDKLPGRLIDRLPPSFSWADPSLDATLWGKLDDCLQLDGALYAPLDHKTRASKAADVHPAYQVQMDCYALLLERNQLKSAGRAFLVYYCPEAGELHEGFPFVVDVKTVETNLDRAYALFRQGVELLRQTMAPPPSETCEYCAWLKTVHAPSLAL